MYDKTLTIFNFHKKTKTWYMTVVHNANVEETAASYPANRGNSNGDTVEIIIPTDLDRSVRTDYGFKEYKHPKEYSRCDEPAEAFTFDTENDFLYVGEWDDLEPVDDDLFESGFYNQVNEDYDGVYKINSAIHLNLLPHFEIGGA